MRYNSEDDGGGGDQDEDEDGVYCVSGFDGDQGGAEQDDCDGTVSYDDDRDDKEEKDAGE